MSDSAATNSHGAAGTNKPDFNESSSSGTTGIRKADAIWQQLKSSHVAPKAQGVNFNKLWHGFSSDTVQGPSKLAAKQAPPSNTYDAQLVARNTRPRPDPAAQPSPASAAPAPTQLPDPDTALQLVTRCVAGLKDSSQAARRRALQDVKTQLLDNPTLGPQWLAERLEADGLGKALLRRFDDPADSCREAAVTCLLRLLTAAPAAVLALLPYAFPVLAERLRYREEGSKALTEPCEEVRLALAQLLRSLVVLGGSSFGGYAGEAVELVGALCEDPFHLVQEEGCGVVGDMNAVLGARLQPVSKQLVAALLPLTTAKRHRVRIAALQALRPTMHKGAHEMILEMVAWRDPNVIPIKAFYGDDLKVNFCGKLATDPHPAVRREFLSLLGDWMTGLRERLDHESRLLPYVLSALNDEAPEIQADAVSLLERLGAQYETDHEKDLKDTLTYLPPEAHGVGWGAPGAAGFVYGAAEAGQETVNGGRAVLVLSGPLRARPRLGTRRLVQSNLGRIVGALAEELTSWLVEARRRAAALLRVQLLLAEEWAEQHLHLLLPAMVKAISDPEVRSPVRQCCSLLGAFTDPELALQLLGPRVGEKGGEAGQRAAALEVLACVIRGAGPRRALDPHLGPTLELLCGESLLTSEDSRIRRALREVVGQLLATCGPACGRHTARLLWICLHLRAPGRAAATATPTTMTPPPPPVLAAAAAGVAAGGGDGSELSVAGPEGPGGEVFVEEVLLPRLADVCGYGGGVDEMVEAHRVELLAQVHPSRSPNMLLATGVLCRLLLPSAAQVADLLNPSDQLLARVLPPAQHPPSSPPSAPESSSPPGTRTRTTADMEVDTAHPASTTSPTPTASPSARPLHWQPASTAAALTALASCLPNLQRQPRCATLCFVCLEACLAALPAPNIPSIPGGTHTHVTSAHLDGTGMVVAGTDDTEVLPDAGAQEGDRNGGGEGSKAWTGASTAGEGGAQAEAAGAACERHLLRLLSGSLAGCQELPPTALLAALRCTHTVLRLGLVSSEVLREELGELMAALAGCAGVVAAAVCRLQAVYVMQMLVGVAAAAEVLNLGGGGSSGVSGGAGGQGSGGELAAVCTAAAARLYDASDEVRCAALGLARAVAVPVVGRLAGGDAGGPVGRLLAEIGALRDVSPGSLFFEEYGAFRTWMSGVLPSSASGAGGTS